MNTQLLIFQFTLLSILIFPLQNVKAQSCISLTLVTQNVSCGQANNGSAYFLNGKGIKATTDEYTFHWSVNEKWNVSEVTNLAAGQYSVEVISGSCSQIYSFAITEPSYSGYVIETYNELECPGRSGAIVIDVMDQNGHSTDNFQVIWHNANVQGRKVKLPAGTYHYTINAGVCSWNVTTTILLEPKVSVSLFSNDLEINTPGELITVNSTVIGGEGPYNYIWEEALTANEVSYLPTLQTSTAGCYFLMVSDQNDCESFKQEVCIEERLGQSRLGITHSTGSVYPNPATNKLWVPLEHGFNYITIYDSNGKALKTIQTDILAQQSEFGLDLSAWESGTYHLSISNTSNHLHYSQAFLIL